MNTVLLVEDNACNVSLLEDMFQFDDIPARLVSVGTGEEALERVLEIQPALILMDLRLPGIDGLEVVRMLKRNPATKNIPIWAISALAMKGDMDQAREAGCCEYLVKPIHFPNLIARLCAFFGRPERAKSPA